MCVIAVCVKRVLTNQEVIQAAASNEDGIGIAWRRKDCLAFRKGLTVDGLNKLLDSGLPLPLVVHFRFATSGEVTREMCHPFECGAVPLRVSGTTKRQLLFHNGVISGWEGIMLSLLPEILRRYKKLPEGDWNDSRMAALLVGMLGEQSMQFLDGKFAVMDPKDGTVNMYGKFTDKDGIWLSSPLGGYVRVLTGAGLPYIQGGALQSGMYKGAYSDIYGRSLDGDDTLEEDSIRGV